MRLFRIAEKRLVSATERRAIVPGILAADVVDAAGGGCTHTHTHTHQLPSAAEAQVV